MGTIKQIRRAFYRKSVNVQASDKSAANSPVKPSAPEGPARMVLAVPDGCRWKRTKRSGRESAKLYVS
ncbi:MAG: hypothetical protein JXA30_14415, partial [Deltaproteobacteria bacterium]|nr:hypothetical protein [Deltaproteobacteria bacterium]